MFDFELNCQICMQRNFINDNKLISFTLHMNLERKDEGVKETAADIEREIKSTGEILKDLSLNTVSDSKSESVTATMSHMVVAMASTFGKFCLESFLILHPSGFLFS